MAALSLAIIGKNNEPLYVKVFERTGLNGNASEEALFGLPNLADEMETGDEETHSPRHLFMIHAALDRIEQLAGPPPGYGWRRAGVASGRDSMFVGLLAPIEDMRIYGESQCRRMKSIRLERPFFSDAASCCSRLYYHNKNQIYSCGRG